MPKATSTLSHPEPQTWVVADRSDGVQRRVQILRQNEGRCLVHYLEEHRPDAWIDSNAIAALPPPSESRTHGKKRKRGSQGRSSSLGGSSAFNDPAECSSSTSRRRGPDGADSTLSTRPGSVVNGDSEADYKDPKIASARRNVDEVIFGDWKIKTWYYSPYPLTDAEIPEIPQTSALAHELKLAADVSRPAHKRHGRASELLAGAMNKQNWPDPLLTLYICDRCFKYCSEIARWEAHQHRCERRNPPGRKVYQRDPVRIWEIDGAVEKLYCQNLSLFGKFFIDVKTLFYDLDNFMFYVLTSVENGKENVIGYFSKEKLSYDDYNLACIVTFPQWQKTGYGMLMIEFSYELSRRTGKAGTPERPLSILGLRSYLSYWVATLVRFFRRVLSVLPTQSGKVFVSVGSFPDIKKIQLEAPKRTRNGNISDLHADNPTVLTPLDLLTDTHFTVGRRFETRLRKDGAAETHVHVQCTLNDIAAATNLRVDDAAFALNEVGLLVKRISRREVANGDHEGSPATETTPSEPGLAVHKTEEGEELGDEDEEGGTVVITREMVERVAKDRSIKRSVLDLNCVVDLPPSPPT